MTTRFHVLITAAVHVPAAGLQYEAGAQVLSERGYALMRSEAPGALELVGVERDGLPLAKVPTLEEVVRAGYSAERARLIIIGERAHVQALADGADDDTAEKAGRAAVDAAKAADAPHAAEAAPAAEPPPARAPIEGRDARIFIGPPPALEETAKAADVAPPAPEAAPAAEPPKA